MNNIFIVEDMDDMNHAAEGVQGVFDSKIKADKYLKKHQGEWDGCDGTRRLRVVERTIE